MRLLKILLIILLLLGAFALVIQVSGNGHLFKGVWATYLHGYSTASITDKKFFDTREVPAATSADPWQISPDYNQLELSSTLREMLEKTRSAALLIAKDDALLYEEYWEGFDKNSRTNSFSMAKTITTLMVQIAIQQGFIGSWEEPVIKYLPDLQGPFREDLQLKHLSMMGAGLQWEENYSGPLGITAKAYYGDDVQELIYEEVPIVNEPGSEYNYQSGSTQILGMVLHKASGITVSEFASRYLWQPLGAEQSAEWHLDKEGMEITYCCFNSNARDFARFGKLLNDHGKWQGKQLIDSAFLHMAVSPQLVPYYGYSYWLDTDDHLVPVYFMRGILGQYVISIPEYKLVIVRLGNERMEKKRDNHPEDFHILVEEVLKYFKDI